MMSDKSYSDATNWLASALNIPLPLENGMSSTINGIEYVVQQGIPRQCDLITTTTQEQTASSFGFKWHRRESLGSMQSTEFLHNWLIARYGDVASSSWLWDPSENPVNPADRWSEEREVRPQAGPTLGARSILRSLS